MRCANRENRKIIVVYFCFYEFYHYFSDNPNHQRLPTTRQAKVLRCGLTGRVSSSRLCRTCLVVCAGHSGSACVIFLALAICCGCHVPQFGLFVSMNPRGKCGRLAGGRNYPFSKDVKTQGGRIGDGKQFFSILVCCWCPLLWGCCFSWASRRRRLSLLPVCGRVATRGGAGGNRWTARALRNGLSCRRAGRLGG